VPPPSYNPEQPLQFLITTLDYDDYVGRLAIGRIFNGRMGKGQEIARCTIDGDVVPVRISNLYGYQGLKRIEIGEAAPGDIVAVTGLDDVNIGETLSDLDNPQPLPPIRVDEPTISMVFCVNDSPLSGRDGRHVTASKLRERLEKEALYNVSMRFERTDSPDVFSVSGRGELQMAILIETMRREGYEVAVGKPQVLTRLIDGVLHEPMEQLFIDCPEAYVGTITQKLGPRKGSPQPHDQSWQRPCPPRVRDPRARPAGLSQ
jgi:GTP-binding protein